MARVLIVDDERSIRRTLGEFLRGDGHDVVEAEDADTALQQLRDDGFDVVVSDVILPRVNGVELLRRIHAIDPHVQVVMMTGEPTVETASESLRAGAADYLFKPVSKDAIFRAVANACRVKFLDDAKRRLEALNRANQENLEQLVEERTEQLRASELQASELSRFNQAVLNALTAHICVIAEDGTILAVNQAWQDFAAANPPAAPRSASVGIGANYFTVCEAAIGANCETAREAVRGLRAVVHGEVTEFHLEYPCHSPEVNCWCVLRATRFAGQGPVRLVVAHSDITERKWTENTLRESEERYRSLVEESPDAIGIYQDGKLVFVNSTGARQLGAKSKEVLLGRESRQIIHPDDLPAAYDRVRRRLAGETGMYPAQVRYVRLDGSIVHVEVAATPIAFEGKPAVQFIARDITERIQTEERIRAQAELLDLAEEAIWVQTMTHCIQYWNQGSERLTGWLSTEASGKPMRELVKPDPEEFDRALIRVVNEGRWNGELTIRTKDGRAVKLMSRWTLVRDEQNRPKAILLINTDITEQKKLEAKFLRAQRMESVGHLAGGIAHDLNNILSPILMGTSLLREEPMSDGTKRLIDIIATSAQRGADVVKQLLTFARGSTGQKLPLSPGRLVADMAKIVQETFPKSITLRNESSKEPWTILGEPTQLHQVLLNLSVNARDAMPKGGILTLAAENRMLDDCYVALNPEAKVGPYVILRVSDTGTGIPPAILDKIFDPFFTTKGPETGTGLGLATVQGIVKSHDGFVQVDSHEGYGSRFSVFLPALPPSERADVSTPDQTLPRGHGECVLVVDDEQSVRDITAKILKRFGYEVLTANEGTMAVGLYAQHQAEIQVVLTDMMMPVMDGVATVRVLRGMNPHVKIITSSGVADETRLADIDGLSVQAYLQKPFTAQKLLATLEHVLRGNPPPDTGPGG